MLTNELHSTQTDTLAIKLDRTNLDPHRTLHIVRDDLLPAGTKQRAIIPLLKSLRRKGIRHLTYASPFAGFAQVALAYGCQSLKMSCAIFCERDPKQKEIAPHPFTQLAKSYGANIQLVENLREGEILAQGLADQGAAHKIPLGFQCQEFHEFFQRAVEKALSEILASLGFLPRRVWLPVGSGTLAQAFHKVAPKSISLCCVDVHVLNAQDLRLQSLRALPRLQFFSAYEEFHDEAEILPPVPSNLHYDAKLWRFLANHAQDGDLWWNVAR